MCFRECVKVDLKILEEEDLKEEEVGASKEGKSALFSVVIFQRYPKSPSLL